MDLISQLKIVQTLKNLYLSYTILSLSTNVGNISYHRMNTARGLRNPDHRQYSITIHYLHTINNIVVFAIILTELLTV